MSDLCVYDKMVWWSQLQHFYPLLFKPFLLFQVFVKITQKEYVYAYVYVHVMFYVCFDEFYIVWTYVDGPWVKRNGVWV